MPMSVAAQEMTGSNKKRKRETSPVEKLDVAKIMDGTLPVDKKGKGKAKEESILGDDTLTGRKAECAFLFKPNAWNRTDRVTRRVGQYVSLDCEFVGVYDPESNHSEHSLARVSIVNLYGVTVLDTFVAQRERIGDWRTWVSGVRPQDVKDGQSLPTPIGRAFILTESDDTIAPTFKEVQQKVADIIKDRILVGHAVYNDLKVISGKSRGARRKRLTMRTTGTPAQASA